MADRNIGFNLNFKANTKDVESNLSKLKKSLQDIQNIKFGDFKGTNDQLREIRKTASQLQGVLERSFNTSLNATNIVEFKNQLDKAGLSINTIQANFAKVGPVGQRAFGQLTSSILTTNLQLKETHSLVDSMGKTMMNTVKWGIASSIMNTFTQSVQGAFSYVQSLQKSLTNIRIVTGDSTQQMAKFADQANRAAQELGRSTLDYTRSSLTFYQQGLDDETVQARTEATLKAQNITGTGAQMADYLTSVWNGYKVANEQAQLYVDKLAAVADSSASDMSQLATAMSKVASVANTMGVDIDQLNAQIATVVATTRQAPESVGTAFKTIYTRMNDIKTGSEEAEVSLGNYSGQMAQLGFNVLDATGHLRDTGQVMEEIGERWTTLSREQQVYLSRIMGGQRQVNQLMALFDNWTTYSELLNTSLESQGTLAEKNARYMESLGAKMEQLGAAGERVKAALIDEKAVKGGIEALTSLTNLAASFIESIGGGSNALLALGSIATYVFRGTIAKEISNLITNFQNAKYNAEALSAEIALTQTIKDSGQNSAGGRYVVEQMEKIQQYYSVLDQASINRQKNLIDERGQIENQIDAINEQRKAVEKVFGAISQDDWASGNTARINEVNAKIEQLKNKTQTLKTSLDSTFNGNTFKVEGFSNFETDFNNFLAAYQKLESGKAIKLEQAFKRMGQSGGPTPAQFVTQLNQSLTQATQKGQQFSNTMDHSEGNIQKLTNSAQALDAQIQQNLDSAEQLFNVTQVTKFASAVGQVGLVLNNFANIKRIVKDEDLTASQKLRQILTNASFTFVTMVNVAKNLSDTLGVSAAIEQKRVLTQRLASLEVAKEAQQRKLALLEQQQSNNNLEIARRQAENRTLQQQKLLEEKRAESAMNAYLANQERLRNAEAQKGVLIQEKRLATQQGLDTTAIQKEIDLQQREIDLSKRAMQANQRKFQQRMQNVDKLSQKMESNKTIIESLKTENNNIASAISGISSKIFFFQRNIDMIKSKIGNLGSTFQQVIGNIGSKLHGLFTNFIVPLMTNPFTWVAIAAVAIGVVLYRAWTKQARAAEKANKVAADAKQSYEDLKSSLEDVKSALNQLHKAEDALNDLTVGTQEWRDALQEVNNQVLDLIAKYPELSDYVTNTNGQLGIDAKKEQEYLQKRTQGVQNARNASYIATSQARQADAMAAAAEIGHKSRIHDANAETYTMATAEQVMDVIKARQKAIDKDKEPDDYKYIADLANVDEELTKAILSNETEVVELTKQLQQNQQADKLLYESMAQQKLQDNAIYKNASDLNKQVISALGGVDLQKATEDAAKDLGQKIDDNLDIWSGADSKFLQDLLKRFNDAKGTDYKLASNAVRGTDTNRTFAFLEGNQQKTFTKQEIVATIAATQALQGLGASAEEASNILKKIDNSNNLNDDQKTGLKQFLAGQDITNLDQETLKSFQNQNFDLSQYIDVEALAKKWDITTDEVTERFGTAVQGSLEQFDKLSRKSVSSFVNQTTKQLINQSNRTQSLTLDDAKAMQENLQDVYREFGKTGLDALQELYSDKDAFKIDDILSDFDWKTGTFEDLQDAFDDGGIAADEYKEALYLLYQQQKENAEITSPESNYKSIHDITDGLEKNDTIQGEDIDTLKAAFDQAGVNFDYFFEKMPDGSRRLKVSAEEFQAAVEQISLQPFRDEISELENKVAGVDSFQNKVEEKNITSQNLFGSAATISGDVGVEKIDYDKRDLQLEYLNLLMLWEEEQLKLTDLQTKKNENTAYTIQDWETLNRLLSAHTSEFENLEGVTEAEKQRILELKEELANAQPLHILDEDVNQDEWEDLTDHIKNYADQIEGLSDDLKDNEQAAGDVAQAMLRYDSAIAKVQENYDDLLEKLSSDSLQDQVEATQELENIYSDLLDLPFDNVLSDDFLGDPQHLKDLQEAANGSEEAYNRLAEAAAKDILINCGITTERFDADKAWIQSQIVDGTSFPDLEIGASIDDENFIAGLQQMVNAAGMTKEQATNYLSQMGVDAEVIETDSQATEKNQRTDFEAEAQPVPLPYKIPFADGTQVQEETGAGSVSGVWYKPRENVMEDTKENKAFSLKITSAKKSSGGGFKYKNASHKGNSGGGGKGKGGGGGGKGSQPKTPKSSKGVTTKTDPYRKVNNALKRTGKELEKVRKQQEKLSGKELLKNLDKQRELIDKQVKLQRQKLAIAKQEQAQLKNTLNTYLQSTGVQLKLDKNGTIANWEEVTTAAAKKSNDIIAQYNAMSAEDQEKEENKKMAERATADYNNFVKMLKDYEKVTEDEIPDIANNISELLNEQLEANLTEFNYTINLKLKLGDAIREYNKFKKTFLDQLGQDNVLGNIGYARANINSYAVQNAGLTDKIRNTIGRLRRIRDANKKGLSNEEFFDPLYGRSQEKAQKALDEYTKEAYSSLEGLHDEVENLRDDVFDAIDQVRDKFDEQLGEYDFIRENLDYGESLVQMMYGDDAYDQMSKFYEEERKNNNEQLQAQYNQTQFWRQKMNYAIKQYNAATSDEQKEFWRKQLKEYEDSWMDSQKKLNDTFKESIEKIQQTYTQGVQNIYKAMEKSVAGNLGFDYIKDEWDLINDYTDRYLDKVDALYELDNLNSLVDDAMKQADGNPKAIQALKDFQNTELAYLKDKDKLTQWDIDKANAMLQIKVKELALENAKNNKSKLRLRRDSQGNYTYQYVADDSDVNKAQQDLAKARKDLWDMTRDEYKSDSEDYYKYYTQMMQELQKIDEDTTLSMEERAERRAMIIERYTPILKQIEEEMGVVKDFMPTAYAESVSTSLHESLKFTPTEINALIAQAVPQMSSNMSEMIKTINKNGLQSYVNTITAAVEPLREKMETDLEEAESYAHINLDNIYGSISGTVEKAQTLLEKNDDILAANTTLLETAQQEASEGYRDSLNDVNTSLITVTDSAARFSQALDLINSSLERTPTPIDVKAYDPDTVTAEDATEGQIYQVTQSIEEKLKQGIDVFPKFNQNGEVVMASAATGMYTGTWGSTGKLGILHEKELVLNAADTANILSAVEIARQMENLIDNINLNNSILNGAAVVDKAQNQNGAGVIEQRVHIQASFPNVTAQKEIEKAFESLVNQAYQYANRK